MKFGASTWLWTSPFDGSDVSLLKRIADHGFDFVEIPVEDPQTIDVERIGSALLEYKLEAIVCAVVVGERDLTSEDEAVRANALQYFESCIQIANAWGSPYVVGPIYAPVGKARLSSESGRQAEWKRSVSSLKTLAATANKAGVKLGLEPLNRFETDMVNTVDDAVRLLDEVGSDGLGVSLDSFHMNIEEVDFRKAVLKAGERLLHVQVSDSHRGVPGEGNSDWRGLLDGLRDIDYQGKVSIESFSPDSSSLAEAVCIWKRFASSQDAFAAKGLGFLKKWYAWD